MIAFPSSELTGFASHLYGCFADSLRIARVLEVASFCGMQEDGKGGYIELWTLIKAIPGHPAGSTVVRSTIEAHLFPASQP